MMKSAALVSRIEGTEKNQRKVVEYFLCKQQSTKYGIAYAIECGVGIWSPSMTNIGMSDQPRER